MTTKEALEITANVMNEVANEMCRDKESAEIRAALAVLRTRLTEYDTLKEENEKWGETCAKALNERDTLKAEVERLRADYEYKNEQLGAAILRADALTAELESLTSVTDALVEVLEARAEKAEAELERFRIEAENHTNAEAELELTNDRQAVQSENDKEDANGK